MSMVTYWLAEVAAPPEVGEMLVIDSGSTLALIVTGVLVGELSDLTNT